MQKIAQVFFGILLAGVVAAIFVPLDWLGVSSAPMVDVEHVRTFSTRTVAEPGDADEAALRIDFAVSPRGGDIYVEGFAPDDLNVGPAWSLSPDSTPDRVRVEAAVVSVHGKIYPSDTLAPAAARYLVRDGEKRIFSLTVLVRAIAGNASTGVQLRSIRWRAASDLDRRRRVALDPDDFTTDLVIGLYVR